MNIFANIAIRIKRFYRNLKNVITWMPVIWKDRNWDQSYVYKILYKKLELKEAFFRSNESFAMSSNQTADEINEVKTLLHKLIYHNYLGEALSEFNKKYGEDHNIFDIDENGMMVDLLDDEGLDMFRKAGQDSDIAYEKDKDRVFKLMSEKIEGWWD